MLSKKTVIITVIILVSLVAGGFIGFYFYTKQSGPTNPGTPNDRDFANYDPITDVPVGTSTDTTVVVTGDPAAEPIIPRLRKISDEPVAGSDFVNIDIIATSTRTTEPADLSRGGQPQATAAPRIIGTREVIRFIERASGHIYETSTTTPTTVRVSNTTVPKIYESFFFAKGDSLILRDLVGGTDVIRTQYASLRLASTTEEEKVLELRDLPLNLLQVVRSPSKTQLFSIQKDGVTGILTAPDGGAVQNIFELPFREWLVQWPERRSIILTTKPSGFFPGFAYLLNPETKTFTRILGGISGLTTNTSQDANKILYSKSESGSIRLFVFNRRTGQSIDTQFKTLPEKCTWANTEVNTIYCAIPENIAFNTYPDIWYQGGITFSDSIWKINIDTFEARLISKPQTEVGEIIDVQSIQINPTDDYLLIQNKITLDLWGLRLKDLPKIEIDPLTIVGTSTATTSR